MDKHYYALLKSAASGLGYKLKRNADVIGVRWAYVLSHKRREEFHTFNTLDAVSKALSDMARKEDAAREDRRKKAK